MIKAKVKPHSGLKISRFRKSMMTGSASRIAAAVNPRWAITNPIPMAMTNMEPNTTGLFSFSAPLGSNIGLVFNLLFYYFVTFFLSEFHTLYTD